MWTTRCKGADVGVLTLLALAAGTLAIGVGPATATEHSTVTADGPDIPVLGQATGLVTAGTNDESQGLVSLHGVRRTEKSTVVYWSIGWMPDTRTGSRLDLVGTAGHRASTMAWGRPHGASTPDVGVVDTKGMKAYTPVIDSEEDCYCSNWLSALPSDRSADVKPPAGKAYVMYAVLPELPKDLDTATVKVEGKVFTDIPIEDGKMTPEVDDDEPILVGTGWPKLDPASINDVDDRNRFVYPLSKNSALLDSAVSSREEKDQTSIDISADVLFDVDKATLTSEAKKEIQTAAQEIEDAKATGTITITGHTDSDGADDHNQDLSERRAKAVAKEITPQLPNGVKAKTAGKGETEPIASNESDAGKTKNRRVTITVPGGDS